MRRTAGRTQSPHEHAISPRTFPFWHVNRRGLPPEATPGDKELKLEGKHWLPGAFSSSDALGIHDLPALMENIERHIDAKEAGRVEFVPGFFSDSLPKLDLSRFRKATLVDIDGGHALTCMGIVP